MAELSEASPQDLAENPDEPQLHAILSTAETNAREATELARLRRRYTDRTRSPALPPENKPTSLIFHGIWAVKKFWRRQVSITVDHDTCRDHLGLVLYTGFNWRFGRYVRKYNMQKSSALERTFLGYLRTSMALSMIGVAVAQLFRLQNSPNAYTVFGFYVLGKPLSSVCQAAAIYTLMIGAFRTWRIQNAMVRGKAISGGYEVVALAAGILLILIMFLVLLLAVDASKEAT